MFLPLTGHRHGGHSSLLRLAALFVAAISGTLLVVVHAGAGPATRATAAGWTTVFRDDFSASAGSPLSSNWLYDIGTSYPGGAAQWGTGEIETATKSTANVYQDGSGHLVIKPIRDSAGQWTSGRVETQRTDFAAPAGGQLELSASIKQPNPVSGLGYWPAFWALGAAARPVSATDWPSVGELDVMEDVNALSQVSHTFHCGVWGQPPCNEPDGISSGLKACSGCQTGYHTYAVVLDRTDPNSEQLRFSTDGVVQFVVAQDAVSPDIWAAAVHHGFYLILDVAIDGSYPNKVCACDSTTGSPSSGAGMSVDWVAASESTGSTSSTPPTSSAPPTTSTAPVSTAPASTAPVSTPPVSGAGGTIQAEAADAQSGTRTQPTSDVGGGDNVGWIANGDWLQFDAVNFGSTPKTQFIARVASGAAAGVSGLVEVHLDSRSGPSIATFAIANTGSWQSWRTVPANMTAVTGTHTVYLEFVSGSTSDIVNVNWLQFGT